MRPLPPGYNPGRPRPGMQQPRQQGLMGFPRPGIPPQGFPVGPRQIQQPGRPPRDPNFFSSTPPRPGVQPLPSPGMQQPANSLAEYALRQQPAPGGLGGQINPGMSPSASSALNDLMKRYGQQPGMAQPLPAAPDFGGPMQQPAPGGFGGNIMTHALPAAPNFAGTMQQAPMQQAPMQQFSYGGRAGYQMGGTGIDSLPMDYGQSLQVPSMSNPSFFPMQSMPSSPMLNYGQTPLTMAGGGITRLGYQEGGMDQMMMEPQMQEQTPQINPLEIKAKQALELIIQMLIERGIPPEQAREIAIQMVQAVAEGGMGEMEDQRIEARFGGRIGYARGGINNLNKARQLLQKKAPRGEFLAYINPREAQMLKAQGGAGINVNGTGIPSYGFFDSVGDFFGDVAEGVGDFVGGAVDAVKGVVGSDLGKAALTIAAIYASGGGFSPEGFSFLGAEGSAAGGLFGSGGAFDLGSSYLGQGLFGTVPTDYYGLGEGSKGLLGNLGITSGYGADLFSGGISSLIPSKSSVLSFLGGTALGGFLGGPPKRENFPNDEEYQKAVARYKAQFQTAINDPKPKFPKGQYPNNPFYPQQAANGGRIGYQEGGITDLIKQVTQQEYFGKPMMAMGGRIGYALGAEVPTRQNQAGVTELDYRQQGGFVPPIGIKEKADDIPAMLSNNEFVFTADAVRNAGGGNVNKGAKRMYGLMKNLEAGGIV